MSAKRLVALVSLAFSCFMLGTGVLVFQGKLVIPSQTSISYAYYIPTPEEEMHYLPLDESVENTGTSEMPDLNGLEITGLNRLWPNLEGDLSFEVYKSYTIEGKQVHIFRKITVAGQRPSTGWDEEVVAVVGEMQNVGVLSFNNGARNFVAGGGPGSKIALFVVKSRYLGTSAINFYVDVSDPTPNQGQPKAYQTILVESP